jgi:hypothetical protein
MVCARLLGSPHSELSILGRMPYWRDGAVKRAAGLVAATRGRAKIGERSSCPPTEKPPCNLAFPATGETLTDLEPMPPKAWQARSPISEDSPPRREQSEYHRNSALLTLVAHQPHSTLHTPHPSPHPPAPGPHTPSYSFGILGTATEGVDCSQGQLWPGPFR